MRKKLIFSLFLLFVSSTTLPAQACDFDQLMREGRAFLDKKKPEYRRALSKFNASRTCDPSKSAEVDKEVGRLFSMIEAERDKAVKLEQEARAAEEATKVALDSARAAQVRAEEAERKAIDVLDKIHFYADRFGLAYDKGIKKYGFIDKTLTTRIQFKYDEALPFEDIGFAKVKNGNGYFFVDTLGHEYLLASDLNQLSPKVTALDLRHNGLTEIPDTVLKSKQLKVLLLSDNHLDYLPAQIGELKNLEVLYLSDNKLDSLPSQIGELKNLQALYLSSNQIVSLPTQIRELKELKALNLYKNKLQGLPIQIGELKNLKTLYLSDNNLVLLPEQIGELINLQALYLSNNQLGSLPTQIGELINLQEIDLSSNRLIILPMQIGELKNLQEINLSNNNLFSIPTQIVDLKKLHSLFLSSNKLGFLPAQISELKNLQSLNLSDNGLQTLPAQISELKKLQALNLSNNGLQTLPTQVGELKNLQVLFLSHNRLQILPAQIRNLQNLQEIDLCGNTFKTLPIEIFSKMPYLKKISLVSKNGTNPLPMNFVSDFRTAMPWCEIEFDHIAFWENNNIKRERLEAEVLKYEKQRKRKIKNSELASTYSELSRYQLLTGQFSKAETSINRGFSLDSTNIFLPTNLVLALLLKGKTSEAIIEYEKWRDLPFGNQRLPFFYRDAFWDDLDEMESVGIIPEARQADVEAVRRLLGVKKE